VKGNLPDAQQEMRTRSKEAKPGAALRRKIKTAAKLIWTDTKRPHGLYTRIAALCVCSREYVRQTLNRQEPTPKSV
jgi:hypothetical protein